MAIDPPSDIVLDVARAADPARYQAAVERLASLDASARASGFSEVLEAVDRAPARPASQALQAGGLANLRQHLAGQDDPARPGAKNAFQQFEAFFLQSFVQLMLPEDGSTIYGRGATGEFWKSLLAENLGKTLAESGGVGIAERLLEQRFATARRAPEQGSASEWARHLPSLDPSYPDLLSDLSQARGRRTERS